MIEYAIQVNPTFESDAIAQFVQTATQFKSHISLVMDEKTANAKSIMGIISLDLRSGYTVKIVADGKDEQQAVAKLEKILGEKKQ